MNRQKCRWGLSLLLTLLCVACGSVPRLTATKAEYLSHFHAFVEQVKRDHAQYTDSEWEWADKRYDAYTGREYDFYDGTYTKFEKEEIGRLKGAYTKLKIKKAAGDMKEGVKEVLSTGKGFLKGLWE